MKPTLSRLTPCLAVVAALTLLPFRGAAAPAGGSDRVDFNHHIKPLLSDRCFSCHGPDEAGRKGKLRLDTPEGAFRALAGGPEGMAIIRPGDPARSELVRRITSPDPDEVMPPPASKLSLQPAEVALLRRWIEQGAEWKKHWAFLPVGPVPVPAVRQGRWPRSDLDRFVLARLEAEGLAPAPEATREHWLRRASLDLTGLPPTLAEMDAFLADRGPGAHERVVDRLLASPAYGERMAADWLDVARYADTYGYQSDRFNHLWPYRDWVIRAFNRNLRLDDFILWQIAGDLLPDATREQRMATAFNRLHRQTNEGGSVDEEWRVEYNADRVHTLGGAFLGLTLECARCHDHKYDPVSQKDYYRLFAFFNSTDESGLYSHFTDAIPSPTVLLFKDDAEEGRHRDLRRAVVAEEAALARRAASPEARAAFAEWRRTQAGAPAPAVPVARYPLDSLRITNAVATNHAGKVQDGVTNAPGRLGLAAGFSGENSITFPGVADFKRTDAFSFTFWLRAPEALPEVIVLHHQQAGSDAGYHGYQFVLEDGRGAFALAHFWPGNAIKVQTRDPLPLNQWVHVALTYDGSSRAAGTRIYIDGRPAATEVVRDNLFKDFANGHPLTLAARFRGRGFKGGLVDELTVHRRALTAVEVALEHTRAAGEAGGAGAGLAAGEEALFEHYLATADAPFAELRSKLRQLREEENRFINGIPELMSMGDLPQPRPAHVLRRGQYDQRGEEVGPGTPEAILPLDPALPRNRLGLARWLLDPRQPLTTRVLVNRAWQQFFGRGLVVTAEDFGSQGTLPTHPELLDWLAGQFRAGGWDLKALCREIVLSATYRQSSQASPALLARDPDNLLLARGPKTRLSAEMMRDSALAAAGLLVEKVGGPSVKPYQPEGLWEEKSAGWNYQPAKGEGLYRRSLYTYWKRASQHPMMMTFDASDRNVCLVRRQQTSTPLQALVLLNDPQFVEAARKLAERALREAGPRTDDRITFAFRLLTSRRPQAREVAILRRLYEEQLEAFRAGDAAAALLKVGEAKADPALAPAELAAATALANALLSFDESVLKR
ncbi:MAG: hypothetical protein RJA22_299 [Verrucomicrobiota bacterium]